MLCLYAVLLLFFLLFLTPFCKLNCTGDSSCKSATIRGVSRIICNGEDCLNGAKIYSEVYNGGAMSLEINSDNNGNWYLYCNVSDICIIGCGTNSSCQMLGGECFGLCKINCDESAGILCPSSLNGNIEYFGSPTSIPSMQPTLPNPTKLPTKLPTTMPTTKPTATPSNHPTSLDVPTFAPTNEPSAQALTTSATVVTGVTDPNDATDDTTTTSGTMNTQTSTTNTATTTTSITSTSKLVSTTDTTKLKTTILTTELTTDSSAVTAIKSTTKLGSGSDKAKNNDSPTDSTTILS